MRGAADFSSRFGEVVAEGRCGQHFGVFEARHDAIAWLRRT
ncbi:hypothetical protein [Sorangium sp. So ce1000]